MKYDRALNASRVFFILSCVMAHCALKHTEMINGFQNTVLTIWSFVACIGVPCFLIISGLLFKKKPISEFAKKKAISIVIPWLFCGIIIYLVTQFPYYTVLDGIQFVLGIGSFLYYIPVLLFCYMLFYVLPEKNILYFVCIAITICSLLLTQLGVIQVISNFLQVFNWIGYFAIGRIMSGYSVLQKLRSNLHKTLRISVPLCLLCCAVACVFTIETYFNVFVLIAVPIFFCAIYALSVRFFENNCYFYEIGRVTYTIYLLHMPIAAIFKQLIRLVYPQAYIVLPIVIVIFVYAALTVYRGAVRKNVKLLELSEIVLGMR